MGVSAWERNCAKRERILVAWKPLKKVCLQTCKYTFSTRKKKKMAQQTALFPSLQVYEPGFFLVCVVKLRFKGFGVGEGKVVFNFKKKVRKANIDTNIFNCLGQ